MVIDIELRPLLTIVVPVFAVEGYLYQCLESIRAGLTDADGATVEVIAVNDASPDGCGEMLESYAQRRGGVPVIHLPHNVGLGLAATRACCGVRPPRPRWRSAPSCCACSTPRGTR